MDPGNRPAAPSLPFQPAIVTKRRSRRWQRSSTSPRLSRRSSRAAAPNPRLLLTGAEARCSRAEYLSLLGRAAAPHAPAAEAQGVRRPPPFLVAAWQMNDIGGTAEDLVETICNRWFFRDFVVRNPRFQRTNGKEKEAADVLVLDDQSLIAFQVKARELGSGPLDHTSLGRLESRLTSGVAQLKTLRRAVEAGLLTEVTTQRGVAIRFKADKPHKLVGVVILDVVDEETLPKDDRPRLFGGFDEGPGISAHLFLRSTFESLIEELDTLPDFLEYLRIRELLYSKRILNLLTDELDFLALYKTNHPLVMEVLNEEYSLLIVDDGAWERYIESGGAARTQRKVANEPSRLIDEIIEYLHTSIGTTLAAPVSEKALIYPVGSVEAYFAIISELARFSRLHRRVIGERMLVKLKSAIDKGFAFAVMGEPSLDRGILFLCTRKPRDERILALANLTCAAGLRVGVSRMIGIVTEPGDALDRSFDAIFVQDLSDEREDAPALRRLADEVFGPSRSFNRQEWE